jgi:hypothetical protein
MKNKNLILVYPNGAEWAIPVSAIADNRAKYYAEKDKDTTYQEEYDHVMSDDYEAADWFFNNMNYEDVADVAFQVTPPAPFDPSDISELEDHYLETE